MASSRGPPGPNINMTHVKFNLNPPTHYKEKISMNTKSEIINSNKRLVTIISDDGGERYIAKDICEMFEIENADQVIANLDPEEKSVIALKADKGSTNGSAANEITLVDIDGLITLMFHSESDFGRRLRKQINYLMTEEAKDLIFEKLSELECD